MELRKFLTEVKIGNDEDIESAFNKALELVFTPLYLNKIEKNILDRVKIVDDEDRNQNIVAWNIGTTIYVNKQVFYSKQKADQIRFLLHEFSHVLMNKKSFLIQRQFKDLHDLSDRLYKIVSKTLNKPLSVFLTSTNQNLPTKDKQEIISYLMNGKIDWSAISKEGRIEFIKELRKSNIFNLQTNFWRKRL